MLRIRRSLIAVVVAAGCCVSALTGAALAEVATPGTLAIPTLSPPPPLDPTAAAATWSGAADRAASLGRAASSEVFRADDGQPRHRRHEHLRAFRRHAAREALIAQQRTNEVGDGTDDEVWIDLWPGGNSGFYYQFAVTSNGTHFQYSSENSAYSPTWQSFGTTRNGGFTVTMKIPLKVIRGTSGANLWKVQFVRVVRSTGERQIWSYAPQQTNGDDVRFAGNLTGMAPAAVTRPQPRLAVYALGTQGSASSNLSTSRVGGDVSVPITGTSSVYATIHPDFSNVEVDQQTISPTAYQRSFNEVRPFFTQGSSFYDNFDCDVCPFIAQLYTPSIPTPRDGYAFEGKQGNISLAGFDAVGNQRNDGAASVAIHSSDNRWRLTAQTVAANVPGVTDHTDTTGLSYNDGKHIDTYFDYGSDAGTNVLAGNRAQRYDGGAYWYTNTFGAGASMRSVGQYYNPVDGFVQHADIAGYAAFENKVWLFKGNDILNSIQFGTFIDRYHDHTGALDQTDNAIWLDFLSRNLIDVNGIVGSGYLLLNSGVMTPISQNGVSLTWHSGSSNNPGNNLNHGSSATPTSISWNTGRFGPGKLDTWFRSSTMRAGPRGTLSLEFDNTQQWLDAGGRNMQWLERFGYTYAAGQNSSVAVGIRRIIGVGPLVDALSPQPYTNAWNLSFAYHRRTPHDELYFAYGDASQLQTVPEFLVKLIHYFGAEKGT